MSKLTDRASYLLGLAEGMKLNPEKDANRLLLQLLELTADMAQELTAAQDGLAELSDYVDAIDDDLADVEDLLEGDEDDDEDEGDFPDEETDGEDLEPGVTIEYECPHCGKVITIEADSVDFAEDMPCPECGKPLFPEFLEDTDTDPEADTKAAPEESHPDEAAEKAAE